MYGSIYLLFPYKMNWRDRLRVNISKKITTNRQTKKENRGGQKKKKEASLKQNNQHSANKLSHTMLDFESMLCNYFHFSNCLVMANDYITLNVQIKQI